MKITRTEPDGTIETLEFSPLEFVDWGLKPKHDPFCALMTARSGWWSILPPSCTCGFAQPITSTDARMLWCAREPQVML
jgi:hypothetical protein